MITRTNIEEANRHLHALHQKVVDLESFVKDQHEAIVGKDSFIQTKVKELRGQDVTIRGLEDELKMSKEQTERLENKVAEQEHEIKRLSRNNALMNEIMKFLPDVKRLATQMELTAISLGNDTDNVFDEAESTSQCTMSQNSAADGDVENNPTENHIGISGTTEMARNFVKHHRQKQFSISEDDDEPQLLQTATAPSPVSVGREFYL